MSRLVDLVLLLTALEAAALTLYHRRTGRGIAPGALLPNLAAGACLLLALRAALRAALGGAGWPPIALALLGSLLAHLLDLRRRWR